MSVSAMVKKQQNIIKESPNVGATLCGRPFEQINTNPATQEKITAETFEDKQNSPPSYY